MMFTSSVHVLKETMEKTWLQLWVLALICLCSFFVHLDAHDVDLMEARNFVTAREIVRNSSWLVPTLNGEPRIAKPPLPTWITAAVRLVGGNHDNNALMRLPAGLAASLMVFSLWGLVRTLSTDRLLPFVSAAILATCVIIIDNGRRGTWDIYCHSFMLAAIWGLVHGWQKETGITGAFISAGLFMAFSFMSKGPVSFFGLLIPFSAAYLITYGYRSVLAKWKWLCLSLAILVLLSSAWPLYIYYMYPVLSKMVASKEVTSWAGRHVQPFYFYLSFPLYSGIWALFAVTGFIKPYAKKHIDRYGRYGFALLWVVISFFLLSIIPEKKERYLIPTIIPVALMAGYLFRSLIRVFGQESASRGDRRLLNAQMLLTCFASLAVPVVLGTFGFRHGLIPGMTAVGWGIAFLFISGLAWIYGRRGKAGGLFALNIILVCLINLALLPVVYRSVFYRSNPNYQSLRDVRNLKGLNGLPYYHYGSIDPQAVWDIGRRVTPIVPGEGTFPLKELPIILFSEADPFLELPGELRKKLKIDLLGTFRYHPRNAKKMAYVTRVQWAGEKEARAYFQKALSQ
jgi:4-amino-4-deoxy-L-arabinose transferase-like glycosyltransferase